MSAQEITSALSQLGTSSHLVAALLYFLAGILLNRKNGTRQFYRPLQLACYTVAFIQVINAGLKIGLILPLINSMAELLGLAIWIYALYHLTQNSTGKKFSAIAKFIFTLVWLSALALLLAQAYGLSFAIFSVAETTLVIIGPIVLTLIVMILLEQLIRNSSRSHRHNLKYVGIGLLAVSCLDLYSVTYQSLFHQTDANVTYVDGMIHTLVAILFVIGSVRMRPEQTISISRSMAFYTSVLLSAGLFLLAMSFAGYYVQLMDVPWSSALQLVIFIFSFIVLAIAAVSRSIRANVQVFINKHFFRHKYDYRNVWLNLIKTLSSVTDQDDFYLLSLKAVANIFNSPGGCLWLANNQGEFEPLKTWNMEVDSQFQANHQDDFIAAFTNHEWVFALDESDSNLVNTHQSKLPEWAYQLSNAWVISPLIIGSDVIGFFLLQKPENAETLIWEDLDVLKTAGRQLASYIVRQKSAEQLAESKQFDTYNKLTAFIMHDLKNLIAQQALVVENATKHKENPAFVEDAIRTIDNSVGRMNNLLKRLQSTNRNSPQRSLKIQKVVVETIRKSADRQPIPTLREKCPDALVVAEQTQMEMVLTHVIRNAQDATAADGFIDISLQRRGKTIRLEIEDNGCGMDEDFIKNRLFKPFESTKSSMGMGIGAYQVREFIENMGGQIKVVSALGQGTTVCIELPVSEHE